MQNKRQILKKNWTLILQEQQSNIYVNKCSTAAFFKLKFWMIFPMFTDPRGPINPSIQTP